MKFSRKETEWEMSQITHGRGVDSSVTMLGYISDNNIFVIHESMFSPSWIISHLPSGYKIISCATKQDCHKLARKIAPLLNWKRTTSWAKKSKKGVYHVNKSSKKVQAVIAILEAYRKRR